MKKRQKGSSVPGSGNTQRQSGSFSNASVSVFVRLSRSSSVASRGATAAQRSLLGPRALGVGALAHEDRAGGAFLALADLRVEVRHRDPRGAGDRDVPLAARAGHEHADALAAAVGEDAVERDVAGVLAARVLGLHL